MNRAINGQQGGGREERGCQEEKRGSDQFGKTFSKRGVKYVRKTRSGRKVQRGGGKFS